MKSSGFTAFELCITCSIFALLIAFSIPSLKSFRNNKMVENTSFRIIDHLRYAREEAISRGQQIIVCGSTDLMTCDNQWHLGYIIFEDKNKNSIYDLAADQLLSSEKITEKNISIKWRSFRRSKPIRFVPSGITWHHNGTFIFCKDKKARFAKAVFLAKSGRARLSSDENHDGIDEDHDGSPLRC